MLTVLFIARLLCVSLAVATSPKFDWSSKKKAELLTLPNDLETLTSLKKVSARLTAVRSPADVVVLLDWSSSVTDEQFEYMKRVVMWAVTALEVGVSGDHVTLINVGSPASTSDVYFVSVDSHVCDFDEKLRDLKRYGGETDLKTALERAQVRLRVILDLS